ncbi:bifunctional tRNA (5-methylaminomethyl-2-thiouridine)(34)-methyltransferase MnmD/FAD-dependent 5-carboxymethylaminomethyl-2-thiouridine(34) oxidoreductase MnmC [Alteromonas sp. H39]|uniref:bifunctional tRNA (5-methylaminomethyl-2-thiouridine)(34)-methyltransferase MnmD/FAD-dependent 5-carboxymethylaminomethyl-2-thiouridine(34) oxidoreductase MnmC n=1 Tax=Alteromonas sp. H39 TaxID=3389876 RepID=UPI0039DF654A
MKTQTASVHFNDNGTPVADHFDDVYFSNDSGADETRHVFMAGNDLSARWYTHSRNTFVIAETGFGTGLNFLVAMQAFRAFREANPAHPLTRLHFLSTEKFPLTQADMRQSLSCFTDLKKEASALAEKYPIPMQGCHRLHFDDYDVTLDIWMGDVHTLLPQWHSPQCGLVDAWFLDGFAPSKNPDMWTEALFAQMARLTRDGGTFGTFTAAGIVKRGLASAGFEVNKRKGYGRKRDMIAGRYIRVHNHALSSPPHYRYHAPRLSNDSHVVIVGGGLAAAACALALGRRGINTTVLIADHKVASGASGNPQGGFYPQLHAQPSHASQIQAHTFLYASQIYRWLVRECPHIAHDFCGVLQLAFNEETEKRQTKLLENGIWPSQLIRGLSPDETDKAAGVPLGCASLSIPAGGWLSPPDIVNAILNLAVSSHCKVLTGHRVISATPTNAGVDVSCENGTRLSADHLIMATGHDACDSALFSEIALRPVRGQVEAIATQAPLGDLKQVLCHKGYMTPALNSRHALGSTYIKNDTHTDVRAEESEVNLQTHQHALKHASWVQSLTHDGNARAAIRLGVADHQPLAGCIGTLSEQREQYRHLSQGRPIAQADIPPQDRISCLTALGSRGLTTAPLLGELLVSQLCHEPLPLPEPLLDAVNPNRFIVRESLKGQSSVQRSLTDSSS